MTPLATSPYGQALAWTLVHFVWQGSAIGLAALLCLRFARVSAALRYRIGVVALGVMMLAPAATFTLLVDSSPVPSVGGEGAASIADAAKSSSGDVRRESRVSAVPTPGDNTSSLARTMLPSLVLVVWFAGVAACSARLLGGWIVARRWARHATRSVTPEILALVHRMADRLAVRQVARVYESTAASVPMVVGWLKPVILVPAAAIGGLAPAQLEALLAHELAHVRRHDYLVNVLQSVVEILLFYHPAVWWVSHAVRAAREECCDDLAIAACGDRIVYVSALTELATMMKPRLALAATDGSLAARVRRILGEPAGRAGSAAWTPALIVALSSAALMPLLAMGRGAEAAPPSAPAVVMAGPAEQSGVVTSRATAPASEQQPSAFVMDQVREIEKRLAELESRRLDLVRAGNDRDRAQLQKVTAEEAAVWQQLESLFGLVEASERAAQDAQARQQEIKQQEERKALEARQQVQQAKAVQQELVALEDRQKVADEQAKREYQDEALRRMADEVAKLSQSLSASPAAAANQSREGEPPTASREGEVLRQKIAQYLEAQKQLVELRRRFVDVHPDVQAMIKRLQRLEAELADLRVQSSAPDVNAAIATLSGDGVLLPGSIMSIGLRYADTQSIIPSVRINPDGTTDDLVFGLVFGPVKLGGLTLSQAVSALSNALKSRQESRDVKVWIILNRPTN